MTGDRDNEEQPGEHDEDWEHQSALGQAARSGCEDERTEARGCVQVTDELRYESRDDLVDPCPLKRGEDSDDASEHREQRESTKLWLQVMVLSAPGESGQRGSRKQHNLEDRQSREDHAADDGDDLGHANTVAGRC